MAKKTSWTREDLAVLGKFTLAHTTDLLLALRAYVEDGRRLGESDQRMDFVREWLTALHIDVVEWLRALDDDEPKN